MISHIKIQTALGGILCCLLLALGSIDSRADNTTDQNPYERQISEQVAKLTHRSSDVRAGAAEALGYLRAYRTAEEIVLLLDDPAAAVRREAVTSLSWCGGRAAVDPLLAALGDPDWSVAQAAHVALGNLTGMELPFDALGEPPQREREAKAWQNWWAGVEDNRVPAEVLEMAAEDSDNEARLRAVRALGALGGEGAAAAISKVLSPYVAKPYLELDKLERHLVEAGIRSLGRLPEPAGYDTLLEFFDTTGWARHAADALAEYGDRRAVPRLIAAYPLYAREVNNKQKRPEKVPFDDRFVGDNTQDRMPETAHAILSALARLPLDDPRDRAALRKIGPNILANLPSDWDSAMLYEVEADQLLTAYVLDKAGMRQAALSAAYHSAANPGFWVQQKKDAFKVEGLSEEELLHHMSIQLKGDVPYMAAWLPALTRQPDIGKLISLLTHDNGWIRINAAKSLMFLNAKEAVKPMGTLLENSKPEALYGFSGFLEHAEYNDPVPRWRESLVRALARLRAVEYTGLLINLLEDNRNVVDIRYAAALALDELDTPEAIAALRRAERDHEFHSIRLLGREALWRRGIEPLERPKRKPSHAVAQTDENAPRTPEAIVFIKGNNIVRTDFNGQAGLDPWRQTATVTNSGPTMRVGRNLYILRPAGPDGKVTPLTHFERGFVSDCEVSWDGKRIIFARRLNDEERNYSDAPPPTIRLKKPGEPLLGGEDDPWWHIWEINVDGTGLRQITHGPFHDVAPAYLPDDRITFTSSRSGLRDEYHGYPAMALSVMNADGSDIHPIGVNLGGDRDPAVLEDGRIVYGRLDNFYSRMKTEVTIQTSFPDGTRNLALYGPERRAFFGEMHKKYSAWTARDSYKDNPDNRNRVLRASQAQPLGGGKIVLASSAGLVVAGPGRSQERLVPHDRSMAVTSPFPIDENHVLCAATRKDFLVDGRIVTAGTPEFEKLRKGPALFRSATNIDLALYRMDLRTGEMELLYNDPAAADFEARPIMPRKRPPSLYDEPRVREASFTAKLFCQSALNSRIDRVRSRGKFVRVIEGQPIVSRHASQWSYPATSDIRWKNHGGTRARILGAVPLAADGSFYVEVPADRLLHLQVLDADRRVLGNQIFWMYARPNETRSCIGCHENRDQFAAPRSMAKSVQRAPLTVLPTGGEFNYLAKAWMKGWAPDETEERTRTVHAINLIGRR